MPIDIKFSDLEASLATVRVQQILHIPTQTEPARDGCDIGQNGRYQLQLLHSLHLFIRGITRKQSESRRLVFFNPDEAVATLHVSRRMRIPDRKLWVCVNIFRTPGRTAYLGKAFTFSS
jgi:hypothetical protein